MTRFVEIPRVYLAARLADQSQLSGVYPETTENGVEWREKQWLDAIDEANEGLETGQ